ncbi:MAG TPA: hypothetical protein VIM58_07305, partial [Candidatus Methylacidiphilales bacterium]
TRLRRLDPTRPVIDVSGGHGFIELGGAADMLPDTASQGLTACLTLPGNPLPQPALDAHIYHDFPLRDETWQGMRTTGSGSALFFVSEYGAPPVPPDFEGVLARYTPEERTLGLEDYVLHRDFLASLRAHLRHPAPASLFPTPAAWTEAANRERAEEMRLVTTALRSNRHLAGYCFCQWADASGELFGAVDAWRRPKPLLDALIESSSPGALGLFAWPRVAAPGQTVSVDLVAFEGAPASRQGTGPGKAKTSWTLALKDSGGRKVRRWKGTLGKAAPHFEPKRLWKGKVPLPAVPGSYLLQAECRTPAGPFAQGRIAIEVLPSPASALSDRSLPVAVGGEASRLAPRLRKLGLATVPYGNNFREIESPVFLDLSGPPLHRLSQLELIGQLRKVLHVGGCAVLFEPEMLLLGEQLVGAPVRMEPLMRPVGYTVDHPAFDGMRKGIAGFPYASVQPEKFDRVADIDALGGRILYGGISMNMWTRPAAFQHGAALYSLPVGRGTLIVCHLRILHTPPEDRAAQLLLANLVRHAFASIRPGKTDVLLGRCIDPLPA